MLSLTLLRVTQSLGLVDQCRSHLLSVKPFFEAVNARKPRHFGSILASIVVAVFRNDFIVTLHAKMLAPMLARMLIWSAH